MKNKKEFREMLKSNLPKFLIKSINDGDSALVGGAIRSFFENEKINDFDIFCFSEEIKIHLESELINCGFKKDNNYFSKYKKDNLVIELVFDEKYEKSPQGLIDFMDFTICKACYTLCRFYLHKKFFSHLKKRKLVFVDSFYPRESYLRMEKYINYGYIISEKEIQKIISRIRVMG